MTVKYSHERLYQCLDEEEMFETTLGKDVCEWPRIQRGPRVAITSPKAQKEMYAFGAFLCGKY